MFVVILWLMLKATKKAIDIKLIIKNYLCELHSYDK